MQARSSGTVADAAIIHVTPATAVTHAILVKKFLTQAAATAIRAANKA